MARIDERGERIPLTVADYDRERGTVTVVIQAVGKTTHEMLAMKEGDTILDFIGPLGLPSHIRKLDGTVIREGDLPAVSGDGSNDNGSADANGSDNSDAGNLSPDEPATDQGFA